MNALHACRVCHSVENVAACNKCHRSFYCLGKECQKLDWEKHRSFCCGGRETIQLATLRRELCLKTIASYPNTIPSYFFHLRNSNTPCFGIVRAGRPPLCIAVTSLKHMLEKLKISPEPLTSMELVYEIGRAYQGHAIPILYSDTLGSRCYIISSQEMEHLKKASQSIPEEVCGLVFTYFEKNFKAQLSAQELEKAEKLIAEEIERQKALES